MRSWYVAAMQDQREASVILTNLLRACNGEFGGIIPNSASEVQTFICFTHMWIDAQADGCATLTNNDSLLHVEMAWLCQWTRPCGSEQPANQAVCDGAAAAL